MKLSMPRFLAVLAVLVCALPTFAQVQGFSINGQVVNTYGIPVPFAPILVCPFTATGVPCTPTANIYSDPGLTHSLPNPVASDQYGNYSIFVATGTGYIIQAQVNATVVYSWVWSTAPLYSTQLLDSSNLARLNTANTFTQNQTAPTFIGSFTGNLTGNVNGTLNPTLFSGSDFGAQLNTACASTPEAYVVIPPGTNETLTTPVVANSLTGSCKIECAFQTPYAVDSLTWGNTTGTMFTFSDASTVSSCLINGPGTTNTASAIQSGTDSSHSVVFTNLHDDIITGFGGHDIIFGPNFYINTLTNMVLRDPSAIYVPASDSNTGESINVIGGSLSCPNGVGNPFCPKSIDLEYGIGLNLYGTSHDTTGIYLNALNSKVTETAPWYEDKADPVHGTPTTTAPFVQQGPACQFCYYGETDGKILEDVVSARTAFFSAASAVSNTGLYFKIDGMVIQPAETIAALMSDTSACCAYGKVDSITNGGGATYTSPYSGTWGGGAVLDGYNLSRPGTGYFGGVLTAHSGVTAPGVNSSFGGLILNTPGTGAAAAANQAYIVPSGGTTYFRSYGPNSTTAGMFEFDMLTSTATSTPILVSDTSGNWIAKQNFTVNENLILSGNNNNCLETGGTGIVGGTGGLCADSNTVTGTATTPGSGTGMNGDFYIVESTGCIWGPKAAGSWPGSATFCPAIIIQSTPADNATCTAGTLWFDSSFLYVCTVSGTVKRSALSTF